MNILCAHLADTDGYTIIYLIYFVDYTGPWTELYKNIGVFKFIVCHRIKRFISTPFSPLVCWCVFWFSFCCWLFRFFLLLKLFSIQHHNLPPPPPVTFSSAQSSFSIFFCIKVLLCSFFLLVVAVVVMVVMCKLPFATDDN